MTDNCSSEIQILLPSNELPADMEFLADLGFQLHTIQPDDDPQVAVMRGHGVNLQLNILATCAPPTVILLTDDPELLIKHPADITAPNGATFKFESKTYKIVYPSTKHAFEVCLARDEGCWVTGRAGMLYRDLLPSRLGGSISASHIRIPTGGPVPDMVHFHTIGFQLIYCYKGWVKLVYEDQGSPFILHAGDCVIQPQDIRHRVLEASDHLEVIEVGVPATHLTTIDHAMQLPTGIYQPQRDFHGQRFCHHKASEARWSPFPELGQNSGFERRETGVREATRGFASVRILRCFNELEKPRSVTKLLSHDADIHWSFVTRGSLDLAAQGKVWSLSGGDAFVVPPNEKHQWVNWSQDLELLEVFLPGNFTTNYLDDVE